MREDIRKAKFLLCAVLFVVNLFVMFVDLGRQPVLNGAPARCTVTVYYEDGRAEEYDLRLISISLSGSAYGGYNSMTVEGNVIGAQGKAAAPMFTSNGTEPKAWIPAQQPDRLYVSPAVYEAYQREMARDVPPLKPKEPPATSADLLKTLGR